MLAPPQGTKPEVRSAIDETRRPWRGARYASTRTDTYQSFPATQPFLNQNPPDTYDAGVVSQAAIVAWVQNYLTNAGTQISNVPASREITVATGTIQASAGRRIRARMSPP